MKAKNPALWQKRPPYGLGRRLKATTLATLVVLLLLQFVPIAQVATTRGDNGNMHPTPTSANRVSLTPDPTGEHAGIVARPSLDGKGDDPAAMTTAQLHEQIVHNMFSINVVWTLLAAFLVMFMQLGFAMVETGMCRAKNAAHTFSMNLMIYPLGCLGFWAYGFALGWGNWAHQPVAPGWFPSLGPGLAILNSGASVAGWNLLGLKGFFLSGTGDVSVLTLFFFMMVFFDTTATIPTGAMAERWSWGSFCLYGLWVALPYCIYANWVWGGGWLAQMGIKWGLGHGAVDFAGSGVVHCMGGVIALVGAGLIGPRIGKFVHDRPMAMPGHDLPMMLAGTLILAFGWFGFNPGSTLAGTDLRISFVVVNTMLASIAGALAAMAAMWWKFGKPDPSVMSNGLLAGLASITAPSAFVSPHAAFLIGALAGVLVVASMFFWDWMRIDDPVGAISIHGVNGAWGVLALGLFANGEYGANWNGVPGTVRGLFYGDARQFAAQLISVGVCIGFGLVMAYAWFKLSNLLVPLRVSREVELQGLDIPEMGAMGYPDFEMKLHAR